MSRTEWSGALISLRVKRDPSYTFQPGQFARIGLRNEETGEMIWRAYSIVSSPSEDALEFFLVVLPSGVFSRRVALLREGDALYVERPAQGFLTLDRFQTGQDLWLIATGTGLAPYISMVRDAATRARFENIVIVYSAREARDLGYVAELRALANEVKRNSSEAQIQLILTLTREQDQDALTALGDCLHGRVTQLFEDGSLERVAGLPMVDARSRFMLCGNPAMVDEMRAKLKARGFRMNRRLEPGHIIVENYW